jgi:hypothetical protein
MSAFLEIINPLVGRVKVLSAFQAVSGYLESETREVVLPPHGRPLVVKVLGLGSRDKAALSLNDTALVQPGLPFHSLGAGPLQPGEWISVDCPPPYTEFVIRGQAGTVHGPGGETVSLWLEALMEVPSTLASPNRSVF